jgi:hypothetical protein
MEQYNVEIVPLLFHDYSIIIPYYFISIKNFNGWPWLLVHYWATNPLLILY